MAVESQRNSSRNKVRAHRKRLRQQGLRPIQIWVPDMRSPALAKEAHRQSLAVAKGNLSRAAELLGVTRPTLYDLLEKHRIDAAQFGRNAAPVEAAPEQPPREVQEP